LYDKHNSCVIVIKMYLVVSSWLGTQRGRYCLEIRLWLMVHLCVCYRSTGQTWSEYFLVYVFLCFISKYKFVWLVMITAVWNHELGVYVLF